MSLPTFLDAIVIGVMLVSGLLAMVRGFMREILSIAAWGAAALTTLYSYQKLLPLAKSYLGGSDIIATVAVVAGVFIGTLIIVSVFTVKISNMILDSRIGALDRTLGFLFGLARGLLIVVVAFLFFKWLVQEKQWPDWVAKAKSLVILTQVGDGLQGMMPDDIEKYFPKKRKPDDDAADSDSAAPNTNEGYSKSARDGLKKQIEKSGAK